MKPLTAKDGCARLGEVIKKGFLCRRVEVNRYLDVGDWVDDFVGVVPHDDARSEAGVLLHEEVEKLLCDYYGIPAEEVDKEDRLILAGKLQLVDANYYPFHMTALRIEKIFIEALGMNWNEHGRNVDKAFQEQKALLEGTYVN